MAVKIYKVGGAVRDEILGLKSKDIDYAVEAESFDQMREEVIRRGGEIFLETPQYFTIRANIPNLGAADYVLCRKDGEYKDGRHPESVTVGDIYDDLSRRDFTMNAIAVDCETGEVIDPFNGRTDITNKIIRFVGTPFARLNEDKLRAFRAVRFAVQKQFDIDTDAEIAISALKASDFHSVSTNRIYDELMKMFKVCSLKSYQILFEDTSYRLLGLLALSRGIWFKPTMEQK